MPHPACSVNSVQQCVSITRYCVTVRYKVKLKSVLYFKHRSHHNTH